MRELHYYYHTPENGSQIWSLLLGWPFLSFIFLLVFIFAFRDAIQSLASRRIKIKVGDHEFSLEEFVSRAKEEFAIAADRNEETLEEASAKVSSPEVMLSEENKRSIYQSLKTTKYDWRTLQRLAKIANNVSESDILQFLLKDPNIEIKTSVSGFKMAKLIDKNK